MAKRLKIRTLCWECERCSTWNESPINVCWFCQFTRVKPCIVKLYGGLITKREAITCMKCGRDPSGNYDLRKIGGRPQPLRTLYPGTLKRLGKELGEEFPGIHKVLEDLKSFVHQELCYSCYPDEGGAIAKIEEEETIEDRVRMGKILHNVKEALILKQALSDPETFDAEATARWLIKREDEEMAYDAADRRVRFMIREARPVKFSLMKKSLNGDDLLSAIEDMEHRANQLEWRSKGATNKAERVIRESNLKAIEADRFRKHAETLKELMDKETDIEKRLAFEVSITLTMKKVVKLEDKSDSLEKDHAVLIESAETSMKYSIMYGALLHELLHVYEIDWDKLLSDKVSKGSTSYFEIRQDAFGVEEFDTPMIGIERCVGCKKLSPKMRPFAVSLESEDESGKKKSRVVDTRFLCPKCFKAERSGVDHKPLEKAKEVKRVEYDEDTVTRNTEKEQAEEVRKISDIASRKSMEDFSGKVQCAVPIELINYKTKECELWVVAVPNPGVKLEKEMVIEHKQLVRVLSVVGGNFGCGYLWAALGESGRKEWSEWAEKNGWTLSEKGLQIRFSFLRNPIEIAEKLEKKLPDRFGKSYWRAQYTLGNYSEMSWEGRILAIEPTDSQYDEVQLHKYGMAWMEEIESDQKAFDAIEEAWYKFGVMLSLQPKENVGHPFTVPAETRHLPLRSQEELDRSEKQNELWQKLQEVKGRFNQMGNEVFAFASYLKAWGKGRPFETVLAEWRKEWNVYQAILKGNKGNAQPK